MPRSRQTTPTKWTHDELEHAVDLVQRYRASSEKIAACLPGRTATAVKHKLRGKIPGGRGKPNWTADQIDALTRTLRTNDPLSWDDVATKVGGHTAEGCRLKARELGLQVRHPKWRGWHPAEVAFLRRFFGLIPIQHIMRKLDRSEMSIRVCASRLGITSIDTTKSASRAQRGRVLISEPPPRLRAPLPEPADVFSRFEYTGSSEAHQPAHDL